MSMEFGFGAAVTRQRRKTAVDPYSGKPAPSGWDDPDTANIEGAFVASTSSSASSDPIRSQVVSTKSLYAAPDVDVRVGDRIVAAGRTYEVQAVPASDVNPFSGWQPVAEIPLTEVLG